MTAVYISIRIGSERENDEVKEKRGWVKRAEDDRGTGY